MLLLGSAPPNISPYRYMFHHKTEIEMLVQDLLKQGIIFPSTSSFSSPVLLVQKKYVWWNLYIEFQALNHIAWKISLGIIHMVSSISFKCNLQRSQLLPWIYNKFWIDMHVFLLIQWDCYLQDQMTIVFHSFMEAVLRTSGPIATCFTMRQRLRCLFKTY